MEASRESFARRIAALSPEQRSLLAELVRERKPAASRLEPIPPRPSAPSHVLSFAQQRLWLVHQLNPGSSAYNVPLALRFTGELRPEGMAYGLGEMARRHEALRTRFVVEDGGRPAQVVDPPGPVPLRQVDLSALPAGPRTAEAGRVLKEEARRPFDLVRGPVLRAVLLRTGPREHLLLINMPHIVADGASMAVFGAELPLFYESWRAGVSPALPAPRVQPADHAVWERERLRGPELDRLIAFWKERLAGAPTVLDLPTDRPRPAMPTGAGRQVPFALPPPLAATIRRMGTAQRATPFMLFLAAFGTLLHRYTGREDLLVGSPTAGRDNPDLGAVIGFFVNTIVLRLRTARDLPFRALLAQVRQTCLESYAHQDLPFDRLIQAMEVERDPHVQPLVQVDFSIQAGVFPPRRLSGMEVQFEEVDLEAAKYDLALGLDEQPDALSGKLEYSTELFEAPTLDRLASGFLRLLAGIAADPESPLSGLPLLSEAERAALLWEPNDTAALLPVQGVHELFAAQAARLPEAPAVVAPEESVSYAELDRRSNRLAGHLHARGLGAEMRVAVALERSVEWVTALLAVWKAGAACVPLDLSWPRERLRLLLEDSGAAALITRRELAAGLAEDRAVDVVLVDAGGPDAPLPAGAGPDHLAYVLYTSGSTGRPKGVLVPHRALANLALGLAWVPGYRPGPGDRVLQLAAPGFDVALGETALALAHGAALHLGGPDLLAGDALGDLLAERAITHLMIAPATLATVPVRDLPALRVVDAGADVVPPALARSWAPGRCFFDGYGPTEATVTATLARVSGEEEKLPIGLPLPNVRAWVVDAGLFPMPLGAAGELVLGGAGLARGYLGRPDLTAERFVPDPLSGLTGERLYRTGDRVRRRADGRLDFLGRLDLQVKVRGFRVEVEEVEAVLSAHPDLAEAVVGVLTPWPPLPSPAQTPAGRRGTELVAWVVPRPGTAPDNSALRAFLRERLPDFMVPGNFVVLEALPRTASGKVDRRALPAPAARSAPGAEHVPARNPVEEALAGLWAEVLGIERVGVHDNFFDLGGDSILGLQVIGRAAGLGIRLAPRQLFEHPTVAGMAAAAETAPAAEPPRPDVRAPVSADIEDAYPLSPVQAGMLFHSLYAPGSGVYIDQTSCRLDGPLDAAALEEAWRQVAARHPVLRTSFHLGPPDGPLQRVHARVEIHLRREDWRDLAEGEQAARLRTFLDEDARQGFDLANAPLMRLLLARLGEESWRFVWTNHHAILDGWSTPLLIGEVLALYGALSKGLPAEAAKLAPARPYRLFIDELAWQDAAATEAFWRQALAGFAEPTSLAALEPIAAGAPEPGDLESCDLVLSTEATGRLGEAARRALVTLNCLMAGAWGLLLSRYGGRRDVVFGTVVAGRPPHLATGDVLLGLLINTLPLRVRIEPGKALTPWLQGVQSLLAGLLDHQHAPLAEVQGWSEVPQGTPLFHSLFIFENYPRPEESEESTGLRLGELAMVERTNYPLNVAVAPGELLRVHVSWDRRRFEPSAVRRLLGHLETLLAAMATPSNIAGRPLGELPWLTEAERAALVREHNDTAMDLPRRRVHELFETLAALVPAAPAVVADEGTLSYAELDRRSNRLARHLRDRGVRAETPVAVALERSPDSVVALLAVWKAGGAYVPLDTSWPRERLRLILEDSGAWGLITRKDLAAGLWSEGEDPPFWLWRLDLVLLDEEAAEIAGRSPVPVRPGTGPNHLAYILYTSGSTGRPKGAMVPHRGLTNLVLGMVRIPGYRAGVGERVLQLASLAFDASLWEIALALSQGAALHLPRPEGMVGEALGDLLAERAITHLLVSPAALATVPPRDLPALRRLDVGSDVVPPALPRTWAPGRSFVVAYGPTEAAVISTLSPVTGEEEKLPIGRPVANVRVHVMDTDLALVPLGVAGELLVGGAGVARGYLGRPDLTAERFVPDPLGSLLGERLYRTGDLVRRLPDGRLDFLGRIDLQVKVRGFRIELEEVEAALRRHVEIAEAAAGVLTPQPPLPSPTQSPAGRGGAHRLVAWVVPRPGTAPTVLDLRGFLRSSLPDFMVPAEFVFLEALPRTTSGKVDRRALPAPAEREAGGAARPDLGVEYVAPRTPTEEALARIWATVLRVNRVGVHDDFFALGGDSILSLQVIGHAAEHGLALDPRMIFENPTVAALAEITPVRTARSVEDDESGPAPLTPIQRWFFDQDMPEPHHWNMPVLLELERPDPKLLERAVAALVAHHGVLRARFVQDAAGWRQEIPPPGGPVPFTLCDLALLPAAGEAVTAASAVLQAGLDLAHGPLFRAVLFDLGAGRSARLLLLAHHLVVDAVSWRVLLADLEAVRGERTTSWRTWSLRVAERARTEEARRELPQWEAVVRDPGPPLPVDLPGGLDRSDPSDRSDRSDLNTVAAAQEVVAVLDPESTRALLQRVPEVYHTEINDALLAALAAALAPWTGERVLTIDLEGHGREGAAVGEGVDLSRTVGWFTAVFPVRLDLRGAAGPGEALKAVKEQLRAVPGRGFGYGLLRWLGGPETAARLTPERPPDLLFNYLGQLDAALGGVVGGMGVRAAPESPGPAHSPQARRSHLLEVNAHVLAGRLEAAWSYSESIHCRETVQRLADAWIAELRALIDHCLSPGTGGFTPSDFPGAELNQAGLDKLLGKLARKGA